MNSAAPRTEARNRRRTDVNDIAVLDGKKRYFDPRFNATAVRILPGEHHVTAVPGEMLVTILGSCVAACIRDPLTGTGGMNHFMLPASDNGQWGNTSAAMRYGNYAMEVLINDLLRQGARRERLEIKIFGGASIGSSRSTVGEQNARFVKQYLRAEGLSWVAEDLGGNAGRRIHYFPDTGKVKRLMLRRIEDSQLLREEESYKSTLGNEDVSGSVELFG